MASKTSVGPWLPLLSTITFLIPHNAQTISDILPSPKLSPSYGLLDLLRLLPRVFDSDLLPWLLVTIQISAQITAGGPSLPTQSKAALPLALLPTIFNNVFFSYHYVNTFFPCSLSPPTRMQIFMQAVTLSALLIALVQFLGHVGVFKKCLLNQWMKCFPETECLWKLTYHLPHYSLELFWDII